MCAWIKVIPSDIVKSRVAAKHVVRNHKPNRRVGYYLNGCTNLCGKCVAFIAGLVCYQYPVGVGSFIGKLCLLNHMRVERSSVVSWLCKMWSV